MYGNSGRILKVDLSTGEGLNAMPDTLYVLRSWDRNGIPAKEKLAELGLK